MTAINAAQAIRDTVALVTIDSQNPGAGEGACARWVHERLRRAGIEVTSQSVLPGRDNLIARVPGRDAPRLVLLAHMDTVPAGAGWTVPPLGGVVRNGRIYGRGAADMKAGLAVAVNLLEALTQAGMPRGDVILCATVDEEGPEMAGAHALVANHVINRGDQVLALEPTGLRLRIAQVGLRWLELTVHGKMAHAGRAHLGLDANHIMARVVDRLKARVAALPYRDDLLGGALFTCGTLDGGVATNVVPPSCHARLDVRLVPPMTVDDATALVRAVVDETIRDFPGARYELAGLGAARPPVRADADCHLITCLRDAYRAVTGAPLESGGADGHEAYTDASMIAALTGSRSCTVFGPGSSDQAHTADEFVAIADIESASAVLERLLAQW
jgi:succinyl-diaminopimelate desuccinylase